MSVIWSRLFNLFYCLLQIWITQFKSNFRHQPIKYLFYWWLFQSILFPKCKTYITYNIFLLNLIILVILILISLNLKIISMKSCWASWSLNLDIFLLILRKNNLSLSGWIVCLALDILFQINDISSTNVDQFIFLISFGSKIFISLDQDNESVNAFVAISIFIIP